MEKKIELTEVPALKPFTFRKKVLRAVGGVFTMVGSLVSFAVFEHSKLLEADSFYLFFGWLSLLLFALSVYFFLPEDRLGRKETFKRVSYTSLALLACEIGYVKWRGQSPLNQALKSKGRCESIFVDILRPHYQDLILAQNACTLRLLKDWIQKNPGLVGEEKVLVVTKLLATEDRLDETALVLLLSFFSNIESRENPTSEVNGPVAALQNELSLLEGAVEILDVYPVKSIFDRKISATMEEARLKKLVELSTLGKTVSVFTVRTKAASEACDALGKVKSSLNLESGQLTLLELRLSKLKENLNLVLKSWDLSGALEALQVKETYPDAYEKVKADVSVPAF